MEITRSKEFTINMGRYESYRFGARVTLSHQDLGFTDETLRLERGAVESKLVHECVRMLHEQLVDDIKEAHNLTEEQKSFIKRSLIGEK